MTARWQGSTVLLSDGKEAPTLAAELSARTGPAVWYASLSELLSERPLSSVSVLVIVFRPLPKGTLLATLGRLNVEFPAIQKVVLVDREPPLPIAEYLTACGADLVWDGGGGIGQEADHLASIVRRAHERTEWIAA